MMDLVIGIVVMAVFCGLSCLGGWQLSQRTSRTTSDLWLVSLGTFTLGYAFFVHGRLMLTQWLPHSSVIVLGNWIPVGLASVGGLLLGRDAIPAWRRAMVSTLAILVGVYALCQPVMATPPSAADLWTADGICLQSNRSSCSACAAATLLRHHGIPANEQEMMRLCLTGPRGTQQLGLYRGLKLKTQNTSFDVEAFHCDIQSLRESTAWPVILLVGLPANADVDPRYTLDYGWAPGQGHTVVAYGFPRRHRIEIGDPSHGRETWSTRDLRLLWQGIGLRLVKN